MVEATKQDILKKTVSRIAAKNLGDKIGVDWKKIDLGQFYQGLKVEEEHKDITSGDPVLTGKIALVHIQEVPDYYTRLERMEKEGEKAAGIKD